MNFAPAAKQREIAAHIASRGLGAANESAPKGRKKSLFGTSDAEEVNQ
jgi:hypothetical protein